jgi:hypothetical protein
MRGQIPDHAVEGAAREHDHSGFSTRLRCASLFSMPPIIRAERKEQLNFTAENRKICAREYKAFQLRRTSCQLPHAGSLTASASISSLPHALGDCYHRLEGRRASAM